MSDLKDHVVSIYDGAINKKGTAKGSGFCIASTFILTAHHVIENLEPEQLRIGLVAETDSGRRVKKIHRMGDYDVVILELHEAHQKPILECDLNHKINEGQTVQLIAYHVDEANATELKKQISNFHCDDKHWHFDTYPAKGMSGGAVVYNGKAIGIIRAQSKENNDGVFLPLHLLETEIKAVLSDSSISIEGVKKTNKDYKEIQRKDLLNHLEQLKNSTNTQGFYTLLDKKYSNSCDNSNDLLAALLKALNEGASDFVKELRIVCKDHMQSLSNDIEILLLGLLSQLSEKEQWTSRSIHELFVRTRMLVEIKIASRYQLPIDLHKHEKLGIIGKYALDDGLSMLEKGPDDEKTAQQLAKTIAHRMYKVFDDVKDLEEGELESYDWEELNDRILTLRDDDFQQLHRFEVNIKRKSSGSALHDPNVCSELLKLLPDLPIVHFGQGEEEDENLLKNQVSLFYEKLKPNNPINQP